MKKVLLILSALLVAGCGSHSIRTLSPVDTAPVALSIHKAKAQADKIYRLGAAPKSPDVQRLQLTLAQADTEIATVKADADAKVKAGNAEIKAQTIRADDAVAAKEKMEPKHTHDIEAIFAAFFLGSFCCFAGPFLRAAYPPLMLVPSMLAGVAAAVAGGIIFSAIAGLLIAFGYL